MTFKTSESVLANSRDVAEVFGRRHKDVLRAVDNMECSDEFRERNFTLTCEIKEIGTSRRSIRYFDMTKDGFTFLVMGFTGSTAARFKEAYIAAFNAMEQELRFRPVQSVEAALPTPEARMLVTEARKTFGSQVAQLLWSKLGLPAVQAMPGAVQQPEFAFVAPANQNRRLAA